MRLLQFQDVAGELDGGNLHAQAKAEVGQLVFASVARRLNLALDAPLAKAAGNENAAQAFQDFVGTKLFDLFRLNLLNLNAAIIGHAAVDDRFVNRFVRVLQLDVLADNADADAVLRSDELADDVLPVRHV